MKKFFYTFLSLLFLSSAVLAQTGGTTWRINQSGGVPYLLQFNLDGTWRTSGSLNGSGLLPRMPLNGYVKANGISADPTASEIIPPADGGTGAGILTQGSIPFIGAAGVYSQDNSALFWDAASKRLSFGSVSPTAQLNFENSALAPAASFGSSGVGTGTAKFIVTRTGGAAQYGNIYQNYHVTAATGAGLFDVGITSISGHANLTGGSLFGSWFGANTPAAYLSETFSGGSVGAMEINAGNRWANFGLLADVTSGPRYTFGQKIVADVLPAQDGENKTVVAITSAAPAKVQLVGHGYTANMGVRFYANGGTLPAAVVEGTTYYVSASGLAADEFEISATIGGASINTASASSGNTQVLPSYPGSFAQIIGKSNWGHQWWIGRLQRQDAIVAGGYVDYAWGGSVASSAPSAYALLRGQWKYGIDTTLATFDNATNHAVLRMTTDQFLTWGGAYIGQHSTAGALALSSANTQNLGLYVNSGSNLALQMNWSGSAVRIGFFGTTPVVKPTALTTGLTALTSSAPGTPDYAIADLTNAGGYGFTTLDEGLTTLSVVKNLQTRVGELETKLQGLGLLN